MRTVIITLLVLTIVVAGAQKKVLTFDEAIKIALQNNMNLNQQRNLLELNSVQKSSAIAAFGPTVNANLQAAQFNGNSFNQQQGRVINGIRDNVSGSLNASLVLFNGMSRISNLRAANSQVDAQSYLVKRTSQDVINTVAAQYLAVLLDQELLRIAQENFELQKKMQEQVKVQVELGARAQVDQLNQNAQTSSAELRTLQAEITLNNDKATLTVILMQDPFEDYEVIKPLWDINALLNDNRDHNALFEVAKENRADVLRASNLEKAALNSLNASKGNMLPSLVAFFNYGSSYNFQHNIPDSATISSTSYVLNGSQIDRVQTFQTIANPDIPRPFTEQFGTNNVYKSYGLQLSIPIFNGFQNRSNYYQRKVTYRNSKLTRSNAEVQAKADVMIAYQNFQVQKKALMVSQSQLTSAREAYLLEEERYNLGISNFVDYVRANTALVQAQTDLAQSEFRLLFQKVLIEYAIGTLKVEDLQD